MIISILAAVFHSELIADKVGEPFGTIILAISVTVIQVALIVSLMIAGGDQAITLARDTVFAAVMILLTIIVGLCILIRGYKHFEQTFHEKSVNTVLVSLVAILVLSLILPNFLADPDSADNTPHLMFIALVCLVIYGTFIYVQTRRHRNYLLSERKEEHDEAHVTLPIYISLSFLLISLVIVVLLAKTISPALKKIILELGLPQALLGVVIAAVILLPEAIAAIKAARKDDIQTSLNLSLGSALAAIGLTISSVVIVSMMFEIHIVLGLTGLNSLLLGLSVFTVLLSLSKRRTNILYGVILISLFVTYIFTILYP
ncbi:calcium:proton antiporter [Robertkochia aurantiaca]|uniref:calcium:proton antiporter n=1 Tax=Robertkochia aurantiaca TaxID=2873700 RepID=UPI001CC96621|nr:ionic transporter y4hA [Robertkochia sp. 3YJGBD-33]